MGVSYPPNLVHILILIGFAQKIKFLAVSEVRPNLTSSSTENTKDFKNPEYLSVDLEVKFGITSGKARNLIILPNPNRIKMWTRL